MMAQTAGTVRFVYNLCLEQRRDYRRQYRAAPGHSFNRFSQGREVTALRREVDWIRAAPSNAFTRALADLDRAFAAFFAGHSRYPKPRRKWVNDSFRIYGREAPTRRINKRWSLVRVPKVGWVRFRQTRSLAGRCLSATFIRDRLGWFVAFDCEIDHEAPANNNPSLGIDRGIAVSLALSNGETFALPASLRMLDKRKRRAQRVLSRRKRGSARYAKQRRRVSRIAARIGRVRTDWQHKVSRSIADRFGLVAIEALPIKSMTASGPGKRGLNRSILEQGWGAFAVKLAYKLEERGGALVKVNPAYTSQTCSCCGTVDSRSRESQASFACVECGHRENADINAAKVILRRSTASMPVEGRGCAPVETGTMREAA